MAGSAWDAAGTAIDLAGAAGRTGLELGGAGLWAARLSVLGGAVSTLMYAGQAWTARSRRDRIGNGLIAAGSAATTAGMMTAGGSLLALGAGTAVVPPVGLCL